VRKGNQFRHLTKPSEVTTLWPFFLHGLVELNNIRMANSGYLPEKFLQTLLQIVSRPSRGGLVAVLESAKGKPIGFIVGYDDSSDAEVKSAMIYALYRRSDCPEAVVDLRDGFEQWCREHGYTEVRLVIRKCSPPNKRFMQQRLKFRFMGVQSVFSRKL